MAENAMTQCLQVGIARADITPPVGTKSAGFAGRGPLSKLHDPLFATAAVFELDGQNIALISCDLLGLDADTTAEIRQIISHRTEIPAYAITVACTHTHYGPDPYREMDDPLIKAYHTNLIHVLAGVVEAAVKAKQPAVMAVRWGESDIGINRREKLPDGRIILGQNPTGPIDRAVGVLRIDGTDGNPLATIINFQTHPVSQTGQVDHISADYPGKMREVVEQLTGAPCLFLQGAAGNINAVRMEPCYEPARSLGVRLGCEVVRIWEICGHPAANSLDTATIHVISEVIDLPRTRYGSQKNAQNLVDSLEKELVELNQNDGNEGRLRWVNIRLKRAREALKSWVTGVLPEPVQAEVQAWSVGDLAVTTAPGEIFNQIGVQVKNASPFKHTWFVSCANGSIGYVPIPEAYAEGGYEVTHASQVAPEAAGILTATCLSLLKKIHKDS